MNQNVIYALEIMAKGMGSIFFVILLLTFIVMLMGKISSMKKKEDNI